MQTTNQLLDRIKTDKHITSDYRLAQVLGVTKNAITNYRYGKSRPNDEIGLRMADLLHEDAGHITACLHAERAQSPEVRQLWEKVAQRLQKGFASVSMMAVLAIVLIASSALPAWAGLYGASVAVGQSVYYVKSKIRRYYSRLTPWLASFVKLCKVGANVSRHPHPAAVRPA